jgi:hypothetical protein
MSDMQNLLAEMRAYAARHGISVATLSTRAAKDGKFYARLAAGGQALPRTVERVRAYMAASDEAAA